ncbi:MAG: hypothetical protein HYZ26_00555 [Chloroflexi bacterium]|nr:hypothetical protein [Chloroflexota bacterium]
METRRGSITIGVLLVLLGGWFLAVQLVPGLETWADTFAEWPMWVVAVGALFLVAAVVSGISGLAVPACIIGGIGGILFYMNRTGDWQGWAYAWTLIIGFAGLGAFLDNLLQGRFRKAVREGLNPIVTSLILFLIFSTIFREWVFNQPSLLGPYWPALLILWGLWLMVRPMFRRRRRAMDADDELV